MVGFSLFDTIIDILLYPKWAPWDIGINWILALFGVTDDDGNFLPRKRTPRLRKDSIVYEWQMSLEEAEEWIRHDLNAHQEWLKLRPTLTSVDTVYSYAGLDQNNERAEGAAVLRGNKCIWRRHICFPLDPDSIEQSLKGAKQ